jgi:YHS domain-containing protein
MTEVLDPVCGMTIDPNDAAGSADYNGQTYYFCHPSCLKRFQADPAGFVTEAGKATASPGQSGVTRGEGVGSAVAGAGEYTCPMHPEIVQQGPGTCPICGMALEPRTIVAHAGEEEKNPELVDMTWRNWQTRWTQIYPPTSYRPLLTLTGTKIWAHIEDDLSPVLTECHRFSLTSMQPSMQLTASDSAITA